MANLTTCLVVKEDSEMDAFVFLYYVLFHTLGYFVFLCPVLDPLLPGPDVPDPDAADGDDHQDRENKDAPEDGDDYMGWVS